MQMPHCGAHGAEGHPRPSPPQASVLQICLEEGGAPPTRTKVPCGLEQPASLCLSVSAPLTPQATAFCPSTLSYALAKGVSGFPMAASQEPLGISDFPKRLPCCFSS